jgi:cell wall assembly regulator SMI1
MTYNDDMANVEDLLRRAPKPPERQSWKGATRPQLDSLEMRLGFGLPDELRAWLTLCNGVIAGPGGIYGTATDVDFLDIEHVLGLQPAWRARRWLPLAGDGMGNHYVLDVACLHLREGGVFFVDASSADEFAYIVASRPLRFFAFLLECELGAREWPFVKEYMLLHDPIIGQVQPAALLPWNV